MVVAVGEYTFIIYKASVAVGLLHLPVEGAAFERAPATAADDVLGGKCPGLASNDDEVGLAPEPDVASVADVKEVGGVVAHQRHDFCEREYVLLHEFEHGG